MSALKRLLLGVGIILASYTPMFWLIPGDGPSAVRLAAWGLGWIGGCVYWALIGHVAQEDMVSKLYEELIYQVGKKYPGETRHETALRYLRNAERQTPGDAKSAARADAIFKKQILPEGD